MLSAEQKGERAREILASDVFLEAVERVRDRYRREWQAADRMEDREALWQKTRVVDDVLSELRGIDGDGAFAAHRRERTHGG